MPDEKETAGEAKTDTITLPEPQSAHPTAESKDDCSDLTDHNNDDETQAKTFPSKLMDILSNEEHAHIISWLPHGTGFVIHKKKSFANEVLPKYFKASKFTSFTRKLNRWGFSRVPRGPETGSYYHKLFRRSNPELCLQMTSHSGNKYVHDALQSHLLPAGMPGMMPYGPPFAAATPQQQQAFWQQQMQMMQFQMMQMQQQQQGGQPMMMMPMPMPAMSPAHQAPDSGTKEVPQQSSAAVESEGV